MTLTRTIAFKLFIVITSVQAVVLTILTVATVSIHQSQLRENVHGSAVRVSDLIARSTRYSMLLNRKEDVENIITSMGGEPDIEGIRIYNKLGEVVFSTDPEEVHRTVDMTAEACVSCHGSGGLEHPVQAGAEMTRTFTKPSGERVLGLITPIRNEPQCSDGGCHAHPASKTILGVLDVKMSLASIDRAMAESERGLIVLSVGAVLLTGAISGGFLWFLVRRPVKSLIAGMESVRSGRLDQRLAVTTGDELGQMAQAFNEMTAELARAREELTSWSATLEEKVKEKTADLEKAHRQILRVEKMASLGSLASSVAHELNNPLEGILTFAKLLLKRLKRYDLPEAERASCLEDLRLIADESQRCGNIVKNLLVFARQKGMAFQPVRLRPVLDRCALLTNHFAVMNNIRLQVTCGDQDELECDPDQIQQVLIALMVNAIEAMSPVPGSDGGGMLTVEAHTSPDGRALVVRVTDTGSGMTDEVKAHIFEPFFTTKSEGKGVGLGLAVAYGIIERHHGQIEVESVVGRGTTFTLTLPTKQPGAVASTAAVPPHQGVSP